MIKFILDSIQSRYHNVYIVIMMFVFVMFFEGVNRILDVCIPRYEGIWTLLSGCLLVGLTIMVFISQDGRLQELSLDSDSSDSILPVTVVSHNVTRM